MPTRPKGVAAACRGRWSVWSHGFTPTTEACPLLLASCADCRLGLRLQLGGASLFLVLFALFCAVLWPALAMSGATADRKQCSRDEVIQAEQEAASLNTWSTAYSWYKKFRQCDDGSISEGYSESVARLLTNHWAKIGELNALAKSDPGFTVFVMGHLGDTLTKEDAKAISENARLSCPPDARSLCNLILDSVNR